MRPKDQQTVAMEELSSYLKIKRRNMSGIAGEGGLAADPSACTAERWIDNFS